MKILFALCGEAVEEALQGIYSYNYVQWLYTEIFIMFLNLVIYVFIATCIQNHATNTTNFIHRNSEPSAARPPRSMGDGDLHSEMREMKSQLDELKKLVQTSFELQLDIQRSIRQEVAAALSVFLTSSDSAASCTLPTLCKQEHVIYPCQVFI